MMNHLSEEQITEMLMMGGPGALDAAAEAHLEGCARCREQIALFTESVGLYARSSLAWSESRPAPSLRARAIQQSALRASRQTMLLWSPIAVACAVMAVSLRLSHSRNPAYTIAPGSVATAAAPDSPDTIAADNKLLEQVNVALNTAEASPLPEYRLFDATHARTRPAARTP